MTSNENYEETIRNLHQALLNAGHEIQQLHVALQATQNQAREYHSEVERLTIKLLRLQADKDES